MTVTPRSLFHLIALPAIAVAHLSAQGLSADQVIAKNVEAKGGMAKLKAIKSIRITGKAAFGPMDAPSMFMPACPERDDLPAFIGWPSGEVLLRVA